jgi:transcriptional regulator with XRE-family HTH domain
MSKYLEQNWRISIKMDKYMKDKSVHFWENVESLLKYTGKDRKVLAAEAQFDVSNITKGIKDNNVPGVDTAYRIARAFDVPLEYLIDGTSTAKTVAEKQQAEELKKLRKYRKVIDDLDALDEESREPIIKMIAALSRKEK